ncbi:MAG: cation-translocating P-type ATPase [Candidatus Jordarchaeales archaeon]
MNTEFECPTCTAELKVEEEEVGSAKWVVIRVAVSTSLLVAALILEHFYAGSATHVPQLLYAQLADLFSRFLPLPPSARLFWEPSTVGLLLVAAAVLSGYRIAFLGFKELAKSGRATIDLLVTVAIVGAFAIGSMEEGVAVAILFTLVELLEKHAEGRVKGSIKKLVASFPSMATVLRDGGQVVVHSHSVLIGEVILVRPGEKIPLDGIIVEGETSVNQSPLTGESIPVPKAVGDEVYAGTINNEGFIKVKVTKPAYETFYSKMLSIVREAEKRKAPTEKFINKFARFYTPTVILTAAIIAFLPPLLGQPLTPWVYRGLTLLVISCPCALVISTPVAMISSITAAARKGILVKGGVHLESLSKALIFAFDKTGTLTNGTLRVSKVIQLSHEVGTSEILKAAASLEALSNHPVARAIVEKALQEGVELGKVEDFKFMPGLGVSGRVDGKPYVVGRRTLFPEGQSNVPELNSESVVFVGSNGAVLGAILLEDTLRDDAYYCVEELRRRRVRTVIVSGDNRRTVEAVARNLAVEEYYAELLPHEKVSVVEKLGAAGGVVMVGDGVNDAPSLAVASVGVAMGGMGSDAAIEAASITLLKDDLSEIPYLLDLSRKTMTTVKQNVSLSVAVKLTLAVLAALGLLPLWVAIIVGDMGLSLLVTINALTSPQRATKNFQTLT